MVADCNTCIIRKWKMLGIEVKWNIKGKTLGRKGLAGLRGRVQRQGMKGQNWGVKNVYLRKIILSSLSYVYQQSITVETIWNALMAS